MRQYPMKQHLIFCLTFFLIHWFPFGSAGAEEQLKPIAELQKERLILVEGQSYCSAGFGSGHVAMQVEGKKISAAHSSNLPNMRGSKSTALNLDCYFQGWFLGYGFFVDSISFEEPINLGGEDINHGEIYYESFYVGTQITLVIHRFYLDLGVGAYQLESLFSRYKLGVQTDFAGAATSEKGAVVLLRPTWMFHPNLYGSWTIQKGLDENLSFVETNSVAIHFWKRF